MNELVLATTNQGKVKELSALLSPIRCLTQSHFDVGEIAETGLGFIENALIKARYVSQVTKHPVLADDSGLVIDSLNGEPGIYSARYAQMNQSHQSNMTYLLKKLALNPKKSRTAYFYCALILIRYPNDPMPLIATGKLQGVLIDTPRGINGFGYDPIFYLTDHQCTMAELSPTEKNRISHRGLAIQALLKQVQDDEQLKGLFNGKKQ